MKSPRVIRWYSRNTTYDLTREIGTSNVKAPTIKFKCIDIVRRVDEENKVVYTRFLNSLKVDKVMGEVGAGDLVYFYTLTEEHNTIEAVEKFRSIDDLKLGEYERLKPLIKKVVKYLEALGFRAIKASRLAPDDLPGHIMRLMGEGKVKQDFEGVDELRKSFMKLKDDEKEFTISIAAILASFPSLTTQV